MTYVSLLHDQFTMTQYLELLLRIVVAASCGALIGFERSIRFKDAGLRTHCLVAASAALVMILSKYGFADLEARAGELFNGTRGTDPARLAAQVVSGISFLCAGVIYKDHNAGTTKGLTTAAGIWAVSGIGLAIGSGMYIMGLFTTLLVFGLQIFLHKHPVGNDRYSSVFFMITMQDNDQAIAAVQAQLEVWQAIILDIDIARAGENLQYDVQARMLSSVKQEELAEFLRSHPEIISMRMVEEQ